MLESCPPKGDGERIRQLATGIDSCAGDACEFTQVDEVLGRDSARTGVGRCPTHKNVD